MKNYYEILDIDPTSTQDEIKKKYKKLALICHPDKQKNNEYNYSKFFNDIKEAHDILIDNTKRCIYDTEYYYYVKNKEYENFTNNYFNKIKFTLKKNIEKNKRNKNNIDFSKDELELIIKTINYKIIISIILNIYIWIIYNY